MKARRIIDSMVIEAHSAVHHLHRQWTMAKTDRERAYYKRELLAAIGRARETGLANSSEQRAAVQQALDDLEKDAK